MKTGKPLLIAGVPIAGLALHSYGVAAAWTPPHAARSVARRQHRPSAAGASRTSRASRSRPATALPAAVDVELDLDALHLTPELAMMTDAFGAIPDEKTRHKQLLYMASKLPPVAAELRVPANKVPGCLSTVHVDCTLGGSGEGGGLMVVNYVGDSDGLLTKGLLALLIRGLSGCTPAQIAAVDPRFIRAAKISQTLTPGRNNGFLNMLAVMKRKAAAAEAAAEGGGGSGDGVSDAAAAAVDAGDAGGETAAAFAPVEGKPIHNAILSTLVRIFKPTALTLTDTSAQHAGEAAGEEEEVESHFELEIVAEAFEGLDVDKRQQVIRMLLGEVLPRIQALEIRAKAPSEA